jgi:hypothetical protein
VRGAPSKRLDPVRRAAVAIGVILGVLYVWPPTSSAGDRAREDEDTRAAPSCGDDCTRKASDCLDRCEEKFKDDDRARVTCKFECATKRQQCEKECG